MPDLDLVSVTTPTYEHYPMTMAALAAGKHVLCEKPMALNVRECREMLEAAEARGLVHHIRRCPFRYSSETDDGSRFP